MGDFIRVHCRHCQQTFVAPSTDLSRCSLCLQSGGVLQGEAVLEQEMHKVFRAQQSVTRAKGPHPVSPVCPECGGTEYRAVRPDRLVAFRYDRVCRDCQTRYVTPTPPAGAVAMLIVGVVLVLLAGVECLVSLASDVPLGMVCGVILGILGLLAAAHGIRSLANPGKV